jgi:hypothetical protein
MNHFWLHWNRWTFLAVTLGLLVVPLVLWSIFRSDIDTPAARYAFGLAFALSEAVLAVLVVTYAMAHRGDRQ